MRTREAFRMSLIGLKRSKLRTWLTVIGIIIGITAVVSLTSIGVGLQVSITAQFEDMGTNKIMIMPGSGGEGSMAMFGSLLSTTKISENDIKIIKRSQGVEMVASFVTNTAQVKYRGESKQVFVSGLPTDNSQKIINEMQAFDVIEGRDLKKGDDSGVVIGYNVAKGKLFENRVRIAEKIEISGKDFRVIGSLDKIGNNADDNAMIITLDAGAELFDKKDEYDMVIVQISSNAEADKTAEFIKRDLRRYRNEKEGEESFNVQTSEDMMSSFNEILLTLQIFVIGIASISLLVSGVGILNTMYTAVAERTKEIGIMKAIGASNTDIRNIFLFESGLLGMGGGIIGCTFGILIAKGVEVYASESFALLEAYISTELIVGVLAFSFFVGMLSGYFPARRAANLQPVDALRYS